MSINVNEKIILKMSVEELNGIIKKVLDISNKQRFAFIKKCIKRGVNR
jgi:hypothetical protein